MTSSTLLTRVALKNYKSIAACDVELGPLTLLVGPNGAGKSNFLDALRFVSDSLRTSLEHAIRDRGGINEVRRRSGGHPNNFGLRLWFSLRSGQAGHYAFRVGARTQGGFEVQDEECRVHPPEALGEVHYFRIKSGKVVESTQPGPVAVPDRLYLVSASGLTAFRPVYEALSRMGFYNLNPDRIRDLQSPDAGEILARDGGNITSVLAQLEKNNHPRKLRIEEYLSKVVPGVHGVDVKVVGPKETLEFRQQVAGSKDPWRFLAANMSDGTVRALGILVALSQSGNGAGPRVPLAGIEESEIALHPAAAGLLLDGLREASRTTQVIVTSHSPDLLDDEKIDAGSILAVFAERGSTHIAPLDEAGRTALLKRLYTPGELLRMDQLRPDPESAPEKVENQLRLFDYEHASPAVTASPSDEL
ncbi:MAG: AAA family ATPase [Acidobacteria bacterium]|nr:AAA family ATPase [Acidobacteriota bacterium]